MPRRTTTTETTETPKKPARTAAARQKRSPVVRPAGTKQPGLPAMVEEPHSVPLGTHKEIQGFVIRSWIVMLGLVSLVLALGAGMLGTAELTGSELSYVPPVHRDGRVAGATTSLAPAPMTLRIHDGSNVQTFEIVVAEQLSVYNLLRSARQSTVLAADMQNDGKDSVSITKLAGISADATHQWQVLLDGNELASLGEPTVVPGSVLDFQLIAR